MKYLGSQIPDRDKLFRFRTTSFNEDDSGWGLNL